MYSWLETATESRASVVTANLRLARELRNAHGRQMLAKGHLAWRTPHILELTHWLQDIDAIGDELRVISQEHAQVLWERVLRLELGEGDANLGRLAKDARKTRDRLSDYRVPIAEIGDYAYSEDQKIFAAALSRYLQLMSRHAWTDKAGMTDVVVQAINAGHVKIPKSIYFAGFVTATPSFEALLSALESQGCCVHRVQPTQQPTVETARFVGDAEELRAAGHWARTQINANSSARVGIVVQNLEEQATTVGQQIREGFCPGWQLEPSRTERLVNLSYGRRLLEYPAIQTAMLSLRWTIGTLAAPDISILLRSPCLSGAGDATRTTCELALRDAPVRDWSVSEFAQEFVQDSESLTEFTQALETAAGRIGRDRASPASFAIQFDAALADLGWPGSNALSSSEFQLINRWREALNEFAALSVVEPSLSAVAALARLNGILSDAVFQPESAPEGIDVLGPLEAVGIEFDAVWITGMTAEQWPGSRRPDPLLARELQLKYGMPDANPETVRTTSRLLFDALASASKRLVLGYGQYDGDAERSASPMLPANAKTGVFAVPDLFAASMTGAAVVTQASVDPIPPVVPGERVFGGSSIIDRQATSPFDAFALSRLGIQPIWPFSYAFSAKDRGILVHDALSRFYSRGLTVSDLRAWTDASAMARAIEACRKAFQGAFRGKSRVQADILRFEELRMTRLLVKTWQFDCKRSTDFQIAQLEERQSLTLDSLQIRLQADRIDELSDGTAFVLDYKTGSEKRLLSKGELTSFQLILYAMASKTKVSGVALYNINASAIKLHGAGANLDKKKDLFADSYDRWQATARAHVKNIVHGDVRVLAQQVVRDSRRTGLLSRVGELKRDA